MKFPEQFSRATEYFSESQQEWVSISDLPMPHVLNIYNKHVTKGDEFTKSPLGIELAKRLIPSRSVAKTLLATKGTCSYFSPIAAEESVRVRRFFYSIGKSLGVKVSCERKGHFITATADRIAGEQVQVRIKHKNRFRGTRR